MEQHNPATEKVFIRAQNNFLSGHAMRPRHMPRQKTATTLASLNAQIAELQAEADALRAKEVAAVVKGARQAIAH